MDLENQKRVVKHFYIVKDKVTPHKLMTKEK